MLLNHIVLENIGAYKGKYKLDLQITSEKQNVILIGGENGSGKTTLLNSLKIGLFGPYAFGFKTENDSYFKLIKRMLNNSEKESESPSFSITINFDETVNFTKSNYRLIRNWIFSKSSQIKENIEVWRDGEILSVSEIEIFESKLRENIPPHLYDMFLFDGEEISKIINSDLLSEYIKKVSRTIFNLDLFDSLEHDLNNFIIDSTQQKESDKNKSELKELTKLEKELQSKLETLNKKKKVKKEEYKTYQTEFDYTKKTFESLGGIKKSKRDEMLKLVNEIEKMRKENLEKTKTFISNYFPIFLNRSLLEKAVEQMDLEDSLQIFDQFKNKLDNQLIQDIVGSVPEISDSKETIDKLKTSIIGALKPDVEETDFIHRVSFSQRSQVSQILKEVSKEDPTLYLDLINNNKKLLVESQKLRKKIELNDSTSDFQDMLNKMENLQTSILNIENQLNQLNLEVDEALNKIEEIELQISEKRSLIRNSSKIKGAFSISQSIIELSQKFKSIQQQKKLKDVEIEATKMLNKLMRKNRYISSIHIDHSDYEIFLYGSKYELIPKETLSAGEKQILLLSIIWAMFKCSNRKMPIIFDTLLGRLDKTHRKNVITELIPKSGDQVLILSTDTEIDYKYYNLLKQYTSKEYVLDFNTEEVKVDIQNKYFEFEEVFIKHEL